MQLATGLLAVLLAFIGVGVLVGITIGIIGAALDDVDDAIMQDYGDYDDERRFK